MFFSKKKSDDVDGEVFNGVASEELAPLSSKVESKGGGVKVDSLVADVERIKAQLEANEELRKLFNEKFSAIDQHLGEFRTMFIDRDKEYQSLEIKATKAADLVSEIKPESIQASVSKFDIKLESLKAKLEANEQLNQRVLDELKELRGVVKTFRGVEEIEKVTKELLDEQTVVRKIEGKIESYADKTESMFMEMDKRYEEFRHYKDIMESVDSKLINGNREVKDLRLKFDEERKRVDFEVEGMKKQVEIVKGLAESVESAKSSIDMNNLKDVKQQEEIAVMMKEVGELKRQQRVMASRNQESLKKIQVIMLKIQEIIKRSYD